MNGEGKLSKQSRLALYARVSSDQQTQEGTIDSQLSCLRERIEKDGGVVDPALCFVDEGVSGATFLRAGLERLRDLAAAGAIDRLYVLAPDRLARRHAHQMVLVEELQGYGVELVFLNRPLGRTPEDQLLLQVQGVIAEYERAKILERTRRGRIHAARCGQVSVLGGATYGYRYLPKYRSGVAAGYEVVEEEACVVRQLFVWVGRDGCSLREVARRLQEQGVRTRRGHSRWNSATIATMLRNPAYRGQAVFGKRRRGERRPRLRPRRGQPEVPKHAYSIYRQPSTEHIFIPVPALVDDDLFAAVQERLEENRRRLRERRQGAGFLLQGLLLCSCCGYAVSGHRVRCKYAYYSCPSTKAGRCSNSSHRADDLEALIWNDVCALLEEPERLREEFQRRQHGRDREQVSIEEQRLHGSISKAKQGINRLIDAYTAGLVEMAEFKPRIGRMKERLAKLEGELQALLAQAKQQEERRLVFNRLQEFADQIKAGLATADWDQRRNILRAMLKRVEIDNEMIQIVYKVPDRPFAKGPTGGQFQDCRAPARGEK
jgi:site-specific DNA recombinase